MICDNISNNSNSKRCRRRAYLQIRQKTNNRLQIQESCLPRTETFAEDSGKIQVFHEEIAMLARIFRMNVKKNG
jgi:hypothetical protein